MLIEVNLVGLSDQIFVATPNTMKKIVDIWDAFFDKKLGSPFNLIPVNTSNHILLLLWIIKNDINIKKWKIKRDIYAATKSSIYYFKKDILDDFMLLEQKDPKIAQNYKDFICKIKKL